MSDLIDIANEFKTSYVTKNFILNNNLTMDKLSNNDVHVKIYYKRVYHSLPSPEKPLKNTSFSQKLTKTNENVVIDLTKSEFDSENISINKTYTLQKHNTPFIEMAENSTQTDPAPVKMSRNCKTQTEKCMEQKCITTDNNDSNKNKKKPESSTQTNTFIIVENQTNTNIKQENENVGKLNDIFKAKITIVCGYNLPMVKLNGDTMPSAPTTYVIMEDYSGNYLSTSNVVEKTDPIWESEWLVTLPKKKLIEVCKE